MFIVWQGLGFLAILIPFVLSLLENLIADAMFGKGYYASHPACIAVVLLVSSGIVWYLGNKLNSDPGRILVDPKTGQQVVLRKRHTVFWIPMQWFSPVLAALALYLYFK